MRCKLFKIIVNFKFILSIVDSILVNDLSILVNDVFILDKNGQFNDKEYESSINSSYSNPLIDNNSNFAYEKNFF